MSWITNKYEKPSFRKHTRKVDKLFKEVSEKIKNTKKCLRCRKNRVSKFHHVYCEKCWKLKNGNN
jgi:ribosomal protein L37AE/L43A